jgi:hypothetical protein
MVMAPLVLSMLVGGSGLTCKFPPNYKPQIARSQVCTATYPHASHLPSQPFCHRSRLHKLVRSEYVVEACFATCCHTTVSRLYIGIYPPTVVREIGEGPVSKRRRSSICMIRLRVSRDTRMSPTMIRYPSILILQKGLSLTSTAL